MILDQLSFWLITMGVIELIAVAVAIFAVFPAGHDLHVVLKIGFAVMVFGLVVQLGRSVYYLQHGSYPVDVYFPLWISKDIGASILIYYYAFVHQRGTK
jgi:hypothetical protein